MGLLDDAIREHLELKRAHGADPSEVARQEREALGAPRPATEAAADAPAPAEAVAGTPHDEPLAASEPASPPPEPDPIPEPPVERLDSERELHGSVSADRFAPEPDLDWTEPAPATEPEEALGEDEASEDVLEETPEFLQETPEHDRLWFEQRPPRDFDF